MLRISFYLLTCLFLTTGCSFGEQYKDLYEFMEQAKSAPRGQVEPLPTFGTYKTYNYTSLALRSPFDIPLPALVERGQSTKSAVKPDETRQKEFLEGFNFASLTLVGSLSQRGQLWSLINDAEGGIHRVTIGNYLGKNHGKIVASVPGRLDLIEIVPDGKGNWLERPRTLALADRD